MDPNDDDFWIILEDEDEEITPNYKSSHGKKRKPDPIYAGGMCIVYAMVSLVIGFAGCAVIVLILKHFFGWWT